LAGIAGQGQKSKKKGGNHPNPRGAARRFRTKPELRNVPHECHKKQRKRRATEKTGGKTCNMKKEGRTSPDDNAEEGKKNIRDRKTGTGGGFKKEGDLVKKRGKTAAGSR